MASNKIPNEASGSDVQKRKIDPETKKAMAEGRERSRVVDLYVKALETHKFHKRFRTLDIKGIEDKIAQLDNEISRTAGVTKVLLTQSRRDLAKQLDTQGRAEEFEQLETTFISIAKQFSIERAISYETWRDIGVPVRILAKAVIYPLMPGRNRLLDQRISANPRR